MSRRFAATDLLVAAAIAFFGTAAQAACDTGLAERMHGKLHPNRALDHERAVCEPWRGFLGRFIVILPMPVPVALSEPGLTEFDVEVLVVQQADNGNTERARIVSRSMEPRGLSEDTTRIASIKIDTARYALAPDARAFGVRIVYQSAVRESPYESERLSLYVPDGTKLHKVLDELELERQSGDWDTNCSGTFRTVRSTLLIARTTTNGYADLMLRQTGSNSRSSLVGEECVTRERPATFKSTSLHFDGERYRIPGEVKSN
ncbi:hypothetical protein ACSFA3_03725 [Variovorax sp. RHLX14]|uniref:hypothetical protein n=1 Tax=Variovorax sp. RHLX14 TaxID=1259731 RepID=UPI003F4475D8